MRLIVQEIILVFRVVLGFVFITLAAEGHAQQRAQYTQYMFSGLVINPAFAGTDGALSVTAIDRHQWRGIDGAPATQTLSLHALNRKRKVGLGMVISNDRIGIHQNLTAQGSYAYHLSVGKRAFLALGLQAGIFHVKSDYGSLVSASSQDPRLNNLSVNELFLEMGAGIYFRNRRFHLGISSPELLPKSTSINDTTSVQFKSINMLFFLKYRMRLSPTWDAEPATLIKHFNHVPLSAEAAFTFIYKDVLTAGASYRMNESIGYLLRMKATPQLQVGYAYDHPIGIVSGVSKGSSELMVQYLFRYERAGIKSPRI
jgi:type IX secretion system PorP/SprF family membrane protein